MKKNYGHRHRERTWLHINSAMLDIQIFDQNFLKSYAQLLCFGNSGKSPSRYLGKGMKIQLIYLVTNSDKTNYEGGGIWILVSISLTYLFLLSFLLLASSCKTLFLASCISVVHLLQLMNQIDTLLLITSIVYLRVYSVVQFWVLLNAESHVSTVTVSYRTLSPAFFFLNFLLTTHTDFTLVE